MPDLSSEIFSAHDDAEGEFFSVAAENTARNGEAGQARKAGQESLACAVPVHPGWEERGTTRSG